MMFWYEGNGNFRYSPNLNNVQPYNAIHLDGDKIKALLRDYKINRILE